MRSSRRGALVFATCCIVPLLAAAGETRSPAQAPAPEMDAARLVELALAANGELLAARQRSAEARALLLQAGLRPNPTLEVGAVNGAVLHSAGESEWTLGYAHTFETGGKRDRRVQVRRLGVQLADFSISDRGRQLRADVKNRYAEALASVRNLESTERLLDLTGQSLHIAAARTREGEGAPLEESLIQVEVNRLESDRLLFRNQVEGALLDLKMLAGMPLEESLRLGGRLSAPALALSLADALRLALGSRPDLAAARLEDEMGEAEIALARTEAVPDVVVSGSYSRVSSRFDQFGYSAPGGPLVPLRDTDHVLAAGLSISLPARNRNQGNIQAALARREGARLRARYLELAVRREVESSWARFETVSRALKLFENGVVAKSESNLEVIRAAYDLGELRLLDVITEQRRLVETQKAYTGILKESYLAAVDLERAVGSPIF